MNKELLEKVKPIHDPFLNHIGGKVTDIDEGMAVVSIEKLEDYCFNPIGSVHGGIIFSISDEAAGTAVYTTGEAFTTMDSNIHFLRPAMKGNAISIRAIAKIKKRGRRIAVCECDVLDQNDSVLATGTYTYMSIN